jgi:hypothetical protein
MARNTDDGAQLWSCDPSGGISPFLCESGDWQLAAANTIGDTQLTQLNDPEVESISMIVSTSTWLYIGFDTASGVQVYRTDVSTSLTPSSFEGQGGCVAGDPLACPGIGGAGLGDPTSTKILDAKSLTTSGTNNVWVTLGDSSGTGPARLVLIP